MTVRSLFIAAVCGALLAGCASLPGGSSAPPPSSAPSSASSSAPESVAESVAAIVPEPRTKPATASTIPAYVGVWARNPAQCGKDQELDDAPMDMGVDGYDQHEVHCDFDTVDQTGPAAWTIAMTCNVESDVQSHVMTYAVVGDQLISGWPGESFTVTQVRCP